MVRGGRRFAKAAGLGRVRLGFKQLKKQMGGGGAYVVGTNVKYGVFLEFGTQSMPSYPWLRPAVNEFEKNPEKFIDKHTGKTVDDLESADAVVATVAAALERRMKQNASAAKESDRSPGTHPDHPQRRQPNLAPSIKAVPL